MNENANQSFTELEVWKKARELKNEIKELTKSFSGRRKIQVDRSNNQVIKRNQRNQI